MLPSTVNICLPGHPSLVHSHDPCRQTLKVKVILSECHTYLNLQFFLLYVCVTASHHVLQSCDMEEAGGYRRPACVQEH